MPVKPKRTSAARRSPPTAVDLFCGAGGISEGFRLAGFSSVYGNDIDERAIETFALNHPSAWADGRSVEEVDPARVRRTLGLGRGELGVLAGGPPCQGFSINAPDRFLQDPRNKLFRHYLRFVREFEPQTVLFENVPGMLSLAGGRIFLEVVRQLESCGYEVAARILFAAHYGVPQQRWRLIVIGARTGLPHHPEPTHFAHGRTNFTGGRTMVFRVPAERATSLSSAVTVGEALDDLPRLRTGEGSDPMAYDSTPHSPFASWARKGSDEVFNHVAPRLSKQNLERLKHVKPGGSWRDIPYHLLPEGMKRARRSDHTRRYGRLRSDGLAGTVMTKCDPHWGSVFLPDQDRSLTVREAARLQSFPDTYRFLGPRVSQYEQVGNAVPVLMAKAIGEVLLEFVEGGKARELSAA